LIWQCKVPFQPKDSKSFIQPPRLAADFDSSGAVPSPSYVETLWVNMTMILSYRILVIEKESGTLCWSRELGDKGDYLIVNGTNIAFQRTNEGELLY